MDPDPACHISFDPDWPVLPDMVLHITNNVFGKERTMSAAGTSRTARSQRVNVRSFSTLPTTEGDTTLGTGT